MTARRGIALLAAVWLVVAIGALSLEVSWLTRTRRLATLNALESEQARSAAIAGLAHARGRLTRALGAAGNDALADPWGAVLGGASDTLGTAVYAFEVQDDGALLDVNRATEAMLARLFSACGADARDATAAAAHIADWRDADNVRRVGGAERDDYLAAGARMLPANAEVQRVSELDDLLNLPRAWSCVRPLLTVHGAGLVNPNTAPSEVLQALPGLTANAAQAIVAARHAGRVREWRDLLAALPPGSRAGVEREADALQRLLVYETHVVHVTSEARVASGPTSVVAEALMQRMGRTVFTAWRSFR